MYLPNAVWKLIYEFDPTYKLLYDEVAKDFTHIPKKQQRNKQGKHAFSCISVCFLCFPRVPFLISFQTIQNGESQTNQKRARYTSPGRTKYNTVVAIIVSHVKPNINSFLYPPRSATAPITGDNKATIIAVIETA